MVKVKKDSKYITGFQVRLEFQITQHIRDEQLIKSLIKYFECGYIYIDKTSNLNRIDFRVTKIADIAQNIIPFFQKYPVHGVKFKNFAD